MRHRREIKLSSTKPKKKLSQENIKSIRRVLKKISITSDTRGKNKEDAVNNILNKFKRQGILKDFTRTIASTKEGHECDFIVTLNRRTRFCHSLNKIQPAAPLTFPLEIKSSFSGAFLHLKQCWAHVLIITDGAGEEQIKNGLTKLFNKIADFEKIDQTKTPLIMSVEIGGIYWLKFIDRKKHFLSEKIPV